MADGKRLTIEKIKSIVEGRDAKIHFMGVGGVSMYSLAAIMLRRGVAVSGSDLVESERTRKLRELGANVFIGHSGAQLYGAGLAVYSHAISSENPEMLTAKNLGTPLASRAEFMGYVMTKYKEKIGVSGSHGKSTTVAMIDSIFSYAARQADVLSGAELPSGEPYKIAGGETLIYEGCEYKDSFLSFSPDVFVGLNLELDHTDYFKDIGALRASFVKAMNMASRLVILNGDDKELSLVLREVKKKLVTFGESEHVDYRYRITEFKKRGFGFEILKKGASVGKFEINIPGVFNVQNATAAITLALECGLDSSTIAKGISEYKGIRSRIERAGEHLGRAVYYDYAHHPTEISSVINAIKMETQDEVTVVFKPHTYSRTKSLWEDFRSSLSLADHLIMTDVYPAREAPIAGVNSRKMAEEIGERAIFCEDSRVASAIDRFTAGAIVIMGAGGLEEIKKSVKL